MDFCYAIKDWEKHFENSESRRYKSLTWVPVKNKHDGKGYRRVAAHPKSVQVFCAWNLIVQVASKTPTRGVLADDDGPLTTSDLSAKTGFPESIFETAFQVLCETNIGWIIKKPLVQKPPETPVNIEENCGKQPSLPQIPADARQNPVNRTEQNRTEVLKRQGSQLVPTTRGREAQTPSAKTLTKLTIDRLEKPACDRIAREILANKTGCFYDNCKVKATEINVSSLTSVLKELAEKVTVTKALQCWNEAVTRTHQAVVDNFPIENIPAYCISTFRDLLTKN